jgi:hypothetical protein
MFVSLGPEGATDLHPRQIPVETLQVALLIFWFGEGLPLLPPAVDLLTKASGLINDLLVFLSCGQR